MLIFARVALCLAGASVCEGLRTSFPPPCSYSTREPRLCPQGRAHWSDAELRSAVAYFAEVYRSRPLDTNNGGVGVNHAFALWFSVNRTRPKYIIESGAYMGFTTWLLRKAAPEAMIFSLDPQEEGKVGNGRSMRYYHDPSSKTLYFRGERFKDLAAMDWDGLIPKAERNQTFVMLDDHMACTRRVQEVLDRGFLQLWYDDNWIDGDTYSFNLVCSPRSGKEAVLKKDQFGNVNAWITQEEHSTNQQWLSKHMEVYFEFPALWDGCNNHTRRRSLLASEQDLQRWGLPSVDKDWLHYSHLYPPYVKLRP